MIECMTCGAELNIKKGTELNEIIICTDCGAELEIVSLNPVKIAAAPKEEEDWGE